MGQLQERYKNYREPQKYMAAGVYPYFREITSKQMTEVTDIDGHKILMFGSNAYQGLTNDQRVIDAAKAALDKYGSGCAGSRFLNGTLDLHVQLEKELAEFMGKDETLCFSTGFSVNQGVLACVVGRNDYIICDDRDHASIVDGRRLSFATQLHYKHNDMEDLERVLSKLPEEAIKLIVVDGVFSMEGDLANLPEIVKLKHKYNCSIMVDEAHGLGVFGKQGRGVCDHFGLTDEVDLIMGTFSKSLASIGGFIASDKDTINFLRHNCRTYIFSASNTPAATAAALEALHIIQNEHGAETRQHARNNADQHSPIILLQKLNLLIKWHSQTDGGWCEQIADAVGACRIGLVIYARQQERDDDEDDGDEQRVHQRPSRLQLQQHAYAVGCQTDENAEEDRILEQVVHFFASFPFLITNCVIQPEAPITTKVLTTVTTIY